MYRIQKGLGLMRKQDMNDIEATYTHTSTTRFIIDGSEDFGRLIEMNLGDYERLFYVFDENVEKLYKDIIISKSNIGSDKIFTFSVRPEEYSKSIDFYPKLVDYFESHSASRYDAVIVVGGGILIDLASFSVSTYMRGLPFFIIATTLIGQTDASTAGKTCLNSRNAKNLLGTFYYPNVVYNSIKIMETCPKRIMRQGLSEAFKYSLLTDGEALGYIITFLNSEYDPEVLKYIVRKTIEARIEIRKVDPLASNLGHTFGHAIERYFNYEVLHGDAILAGTIMAITYAVKNGLMDRVERDKIFELMKKAKLNIYIPSDLDAHRLVQFMRHDKKSSSRKLHLVMIKGIGKPYRKETPFFEADYDDVEDFLKQYIQNYAYKKDDYAVYLRNDDLN